MATKHDIVLATLMESAYESWTYYVGLLTISY